MLSASQVTIRAPRTYNLILLLKICGQPSPLTVLGGQKSTDRLKDEILMGLLGGI